MKTPPFLGRFETNFQKLFIFLRWGVATIILYSDTGLRLLRGQVKYPSRPGVQSQAKEPDARYWQERNGEMKTVYRRDINKGLILEFQED